MGREAVKWAKGAQLYPDLFVCPYLLLLGLEVTSFFLSVLTDHIQVLQVVLQ